MDYNPKLDYDERRISYMGENIYMIIIKPNFDTCYFYTLASPYKFSSLGARIDINDYFCATGRGGADGVAASQQIINLVSAIRAEYPKRDSLNQLFGLMVDIDRPDIGNTSCNVIQ